MSRDSQAEHTAHIAELMISSIPLVATLGIRYDTIISGQAVVTLPDNVCWHNHVGGPHAGVLFTLAETASAALLMSDLESHLGHALPLVKSAEVRYRALARGDVTATAQWVDSLESVRTTVASALEVGQRVTVPVSVEVTTVDGTVTTVLTFQWTLLPTDQSSVVLPAVR